MAEHVDPDLESLRQAWQDVADEPERHANPGEFCTCGRPARTVYETRQHGDVGWCGRDDDTQLLPCRWCGQNTPHEDACPDYTLRPGAAEPPAPFATGQLIEHQSVPGWVMQVLAVRATDHGHEVEVVDPDDRLDWVSATELARYTGPVTDRQRARNAFWAA